MKILTQYRIFNLFSEAGNGKNLMNDLWYRLGNIDRYAYHYTPAGKLVQFILPGKKLLFSRFENVNDPRESKDWVFGFNSAESRIPDDAEEVQSKINRTMKRHCRLGCFATDVYEALVTVEREQKGEDIVGASYERGHSRPRMWDQYADEFRGVCLIFDKAKLDVNVKTAALTIGARVSSGRVIYKNPSATPNLGIQDPMVLSWDMIERVGIEIASRKHIDTHLQELFFHKSKDWTQEREWRWVVHSSDDQDFFVNFGDALLAIAIGDKFPDDCKSAVGKYCLEYNVDVAEMRWRNGVPQPLPLAARVLANGS